MTLSRPLFRSATVAILAMAYTALTFGATITPAQAGESAFYRAELVSPAGEDRAINGGLAWFCKEDVCVAGKGNSRPVRVCQSLVRQFGPVASFTVKGEALSEAELAACNGN